jgi:hypothetical protein
VVQPYGPPNGLRDTASQKNVSGPYFADKSLGAGFGSINFFSNIGAVASRAQWVNTGSDETQRFRSRRLRPLLVANVSSDRRPDHSVRPRG